MKPVVVLATDSLQPSGLGEHMLTLAQSMSGRFDAVIAAGESEGGQELLKSAAEAGLRVKAFEPDALQPFKTWLTQHADLLHVHAGIGWEGHDLTRIGKAAGLPVVRTEHLPYLLTSPVQQAEYRACLLSVDRVITVSRAAYDSFTSRHGVDSFALVLNGIEPKVSRGERKDIRSSLGIAEDAQMVLTVARFTPQKGYRSLLEAVPKVLAQVPRSRFVWVGEGPEFPELGTEVREADLADAVTLLGHRADVPDLLSAADLVVLPSLFEGLPLVLLEAMAAGVPVVATRIGGSVEAVGEAHPFLAQPANADDLAAAIVAALSDPVAARIAAEAGRQRFDRTFKASRMAAETADLYSSLLPTPFSQPQVRSA